MVFTCFYFVSNTNALCAVPGECQWLIKQFSGESEDVVFNMNRQQGYSACTAIFPGLRVSDVMDLVRVHGYSVTDISSLKTLSRHQGQALMEKIRGKVAGKRSADKVSSDCN